MFWCFRNPPNSDMDFRIFNERTFLCVRLHTGVGHTYKESAQHFNSEKLTIFSCAPGGIQTSGHGIRWISRPTLYQLSHHVHVAHSVVQKCFYFLRLLSRLRPYINTTTASTIAVSLVHSRLDCYNSLFWGLPRSWFSACAECCSQNCIKIN